MGAKAVFLQIMAADEFIDSGDSDIEHHPIKVKRLTSHGMIKIYTYFSFVKFENFAVMTLAFIVGKADKIARNHQIGGFFAIHAKSLSGYVYDIPGLYRTIGLFGAEQKSEPVAL